VTRAVAILRLLGKTPEPLPLKAIAEATGIIPSTCLHILRALVSEGLVAQLPRTKRYRLDVGVLSIGRSALRLNSFATLVQPALEDLARRRSVVAVGVQLVAATHMTVVGLARPALPLQLHVEIGSRLPAFISATGRCFAAFSGADADRLRNEFRALRWSRKPKYADWLDEIAAARHDRYGIDRGDYIRGVTSVAAPVLGSDNVMVAGIVAVGVSEQISEIGEVQLGKELRRIALDIETKLLEAGW
jgi:DNA-binding IclR family transcriptional regulator